MDSNADFTSAHVVDFLLRDPANPSSIVSIVKQARDNARTARTYLTREEWEAVNTGWMTLVALLKRPVREDYLPDVLATIRRQNGQVRGALPGTMLHGAGFHFAQPRSEERRVGPTCVSSATSSWYSSNLQHN